MEPEPRIGFGQTALICRRSRRAVVEHIATARRVFRRVHIVAQKVTNFFVAIVRSFGSLAPPKTSRSSCLPATAPCAWLGDAAESSGSICPLKLLSRVFCESEVEPLLRLQRCCPISD